MTNPIERAFVDAVYPQLLGTMDSYLRAEAVRRARRAIASLANAGYEIVPRTFSAQIDEHQLKADENETGAKE